MKKNIGNIERVLRILVGLGLVAYAAISGVYWFYLGAVPLATGLLGWCPPYQLLGISTCKMTTPDNDPAA